MSKSLHYQRIHAKVAKRLWTDLSVRQRDEIASDTTHTGETFRWFEKKVADDAQRLYEDPSYYDNLDSSFRYPKHEENLVAA